MWFVRTLDLGRHVLQGCRCPLLSVTARWELAGINVPELPPRSFKLLLARAFAPALKDSLMFILRALAFFFVTQAVLAEQPTPILPDPKLTPGDTFDVSAQDVCVPGYAKKVRAVPASLKRQAYAEYGITR